LIKDAKARTERQLRKNPEYLDEPDIRVLYLIEAVLES
jgi:hypothetical protein